MLIPSFKFRAGGGGIYVRYFPPVLSCFVFSWLRKQKRYRQRSDCIAETKTSTHLNTNQASRPKLVNVCCIKQGLASILCSIPLPKTLVIPTGYESYSHCRRPPTKRIRTAPSPLSCLCFLERPNETKTSEGNEKGHIVLLETICLPSRRHPLGQR